MDPILESFADFASGLNYGDLPESARQASRERVMDALGCALGAYDCDTAKLGRSLAGPAARPDLAGRMVGSTELAAADAAAFVNSCMIRDLDFNDTYPGGHPSDSLGALFAVAPQIGASGERLVTAAVVAYEIFIRLQMMKLSTEFLDIRVSGGYDRRHPETRERRSKLGADVIGSTRQEFAALEFIKVELEKAGKVIRQANIRAD